MCVSILIRLCIYFSELIIYFTAYQLVVNITDPKVICVPGSGDVEDGYMARVGYNPYWVEPPYPKQKLVKKKALTAEQIKMIKVW